MNRYRFTLPILAVFMMGAAPAFEDTSLLDRQVAGHLGGLAEEPLVQRNQPVTLVIRRSNFSISYGVVAQESGHMGDYIPVRADRKAKELMARVSGAGEVELTQ